MISCLSSRKEDRRRPTNACVSVVCQNKVGPKPASGTSVRKLRSVHHTSHNRTYEQRSRPRPPVRVACRETNRDETRTERNGGNTMKGDKYTLAKGANKAYKVIPASGSPESMEMHETGLYAWLRARCGYSHTEALHAISIVGAGGSMAMEAR